MPETGPIPAGSGFPRPQPTSQPPMGVSPATGPTPNKGYEAAAVQKVGTVIKQLEEALPLVGSGTDIGKAILECLNKLGKFAPPGAVSPQAQNNQLQQAQMKNMQNQQMAQTLNKGAGAPGGGMGGQMPGMAA
jgi:hypothetical protein